MRYEIPKTPPAKPPIPERCADTFHFRLISSISRIDNETPTPTATINNGKWITLYRKKV